MKLQEVVENLNAPSTTMKCQLVVHTCEVHKQLFNEFVLFAEGRYPGHPNNEIPLCSLLACGRRAIGDAIANVEITNLSQNRNTQPESAAQAKRERGHYVQTTVILGSKDQGGKSTR